MSELIDIVFDGPPGPVSGRFIEVHDMEGRGVRVGQWVYVGDHTGNHWWALRLSVADDDVTR